MEWRDERRQVFRRMIVEGATKDEFAPIASKHTGAPSDLIERWAKRFYQKPMDTYPVVPRLVNRFCVGADPEFVFEEPRLDALGRRNGKYVYAENLGLNMTDAFGADMSGRQAELRAYPSRFVLEVIASLVDTLRWMNAFHHLSGYNWLAPARYGDDGVGGHIHFGRRQPDADMNILSLDAATRMLLTTGVLDLQGQQARVAHTAYGRYSDWRTQSHGYEYRTMPSWMTHPWAAYFTLVVSKLAVLDDAREYLVNDRPKETLTNLLRAYKGRDDDARIALLALERHGFPSFLTDDFKQRWGVGQPQGKLLEGTYCPPVIEGHPETREQLFNLLVNGQPLPLTLPKPTWAPFLLPKDLYKPQVQAHVYGVSDVAQGLLSRGVQVYFGRSDRGLLAIRYPKPASVEFAHSIEKAVKDKPAIEHWDVRLGVSTQENTIQIFIPSNIYNNANHAIEKEQCKALRELLTESGFFPLMRYQDWDKEPKEMPKLVKKRLPVPRGKLVVSVAGEYAGHGPHN